MQFTQRIYNSIKNTIRFNSTQKVLAYLNIEDGEQKFLLLPYLWMIPSKIKISHSATRLWAETGATFLGQFKFSNLSWSFPGVRMEDQTETIYQSRAVPVSVAQ